MERGEPIAREAAAQFRGEPGTGAVTTSLAATLLRRLLGVLVLLLVCGTAHGSGFGIFTQGAAPLGEADAVVAHGDGPSSLFFNPALINSLSGTRVEVGTTLILPRREAADSGGAKTSTRDTLFAPSTFYLTHSFNRQWSAGLAVFNPFGLGTDWGGDWEGRYLVTNAQLSSYNLNPVVSWRPHPVLTVAAGFDFLLAEATLEGKVPSTLVGLPGPAVDLIKRFSGSGSGVGYNVGLLLQPGERFALGAAYRSPIEVRFEGDLSVTGLPATRGSTSITLPQQATAGIAYRVGERGGIETGVRWEGWSSLSALRIDFPGAPPVGPETGGSEDPRAWHDTFAFDLGGNYRIDDTVRISAGYLYGFNPVPDRTFEPAIPDADSHLFCLGTQLQWDGLRLDIGYGYQLQRARSKTTNLYGSVANGRYRADLHLIGVSLGYRFL